MSTKYDEYIEEHRENVKNGFEWLVSNLVEIFEDQVMLHECEYYINNHDKSKFDSDEYIAYDEYFYGNRSHQVVEDFNRAWLAHIHKNPHHWQHWILINDNPEEGEIVLDMPDCYIIEMICDWWSFSWKKGKLDEIFDWYEEHGNYMKLSSHTRAKVNYILGKMKDKLQESDTNGEETE